MAQGAGHQERRPPDRGGVAHPAGDEGGGQPANELAPRVCQSGAPGQCCGVGGGAHLQPVTGGGGPGRRKGL